MSPAIDLDSTLIQRGRSAVTLGDMKLFADLLEQRPICTLLSELPALADLSDHKFKLATNILRRRFQAESDIDQMQLRCIADEIAAGVASPAIAHRIRSVFRAGH